MRSSFKFDVSTLFSSCRQEQEDSALQQKMIKVVEDRIIDRQSLNSSYTNEGWSDLRVDVETERTSSEVPDDRLTKTKGV
jgi:hypothetical protein